MILHNNNYQHRQWYVLGCCVFWPYPHAASRLTAGLRATETAKPATQRFLLLFPCKTSLRRRSTLTLAIPFVAQHLAVGAKNQLKNDRAFVLCPFNTVLDARITPSQRPFPGHEVVGG